jgi:hypothetical protein
LRHDQANFEPHKLKRRYSPKCWQSYGVNHAANVNRDAGAGQCLQAKRAEPAARLSATQKPAENRVEDKETVRSAALI